MERMSDGHEQARPADEQQRGAGQDGGGVRAPDRCGWHATDASGRTMAIAAVRDKRRVPGAAGVYGRRMPRPTTAPRPSGVLFFVHGANETSEGLVENLARIEDQVRARGWDVTVVAPGVAPPVGPAARGMAEGDPPSGSSVADAGPGPAGGPAQGRVMKIATNYFEDRREALIDMLGAQMLADVIGYRTHRASIQRILTAELTAAARAARGRPVLPVALSLGGIALVDLLAIWPDAPVEACVTVGSQAPLLYTFDAIPSMPYDEADPPHLPVPWLNIYDTRDFLSFLAEPLFRRTDGLASVVDLRVRSGKDFPRSHSSYWELDAGVGRHRDGVHLAARRAAHGARGTSPRVRGTRRRPSREDEVRPPDAHVCVRRPRVPSAVEARCCREQHGDDRAEGQGRMRDQPRTREVLDLQGPPPVRQPGYLREARGFASPPRDGFAIVDRSRPGVTLTDGTSLRPPPAPAREA